MSASVLKSNAGLRRSKIQKSIVMAKNNVGCCIHMDNDIENYNRTREIHNPFIPVRMLRNLEHYAAQLMHLFRPGV